MQKVRVAWGEDARLAGALTLPPLPEARFGRYLAFAGIDDEARRVMHLDSEALLSRGAEWVRSAYEALSRFPETARALGWEGRIPEDELRIRRTFFSAWLGRTIGVDTGAEFAEYLHHAGRVHAGYGPERKFVPPEWVALAFAYVLRAFSQVVPSERLGLWAGYLTAQEEVMRGGFDAAVELTRGGIGVRVEALGLARPALPEALEVRLVHGHLRELVEKVFAFAPALVPLALEAVPSVDEVGLWMEASVGWRFRPRWTLLVNGRDVRYLDGLSTRLAAGDLVTILPPGR